VNRKCDEGQEAQPPGPSRRVRAVSITLAAVAVAAAWVYHPTLGFVLGLALLLAITAMFMKRPPLDQ